MTKKLALLGAVLWMDSNNWSNPQHVATAFVPSSFSPCKPTASRAMYKEENNDKDDTDDFYFNSAWDDGQEQEKGTPAPSTPPPNIFFSRKPFTSFAVPAEQQSFFRQLCQNCHLERPSKIQSLAWPLLIQGKDCIVADQTGSGKTLAFLLPLLVRNNTGGTTIILTPTAELADQTRAVCDQLQVSSTVLTATGQHATAIRDQIRYLSTQRQTPAVLVATPGRLATILRSKNAGGLNLKNVKAIVLDEVDVLMSDDTFGPQLRTLAAAAPATGVQFVFATATLPDRIVTTIKREFPHVQTVKGPGLHRIALTVNEQLVDVSVPAGTDAQQCFQTKAAALQKAIRQYKCRKTLVFCNTVTTCRQVVNFLERSDRRQQWNTVYSYHNAMTPPKRGENLAAFQRQSTSNGNKNTNNNNSDSILVCTDRAARGVDFDAVDHVVLFDFPTDPAEYVRRVGRTARAGRKGTCTVLAYGWQLPVARSIMGTKLKPSTLSDGEAGSWEESNGYDMDDSEEYSGGVSGRRKRKKKNHSIRDNIEGGTLWT